MTPEDRANVVCQRHPYKNTLALRNAIASTIRETVQETLRGLPNLLSGLALFVETNPWIQPDERSRMARMIRASLAKIEAALEVKS